MNYDLMKIARLHAKMKHQETLNAFRDDEE